MAITKPVAERLCYLARLLEERAQNGRNERLSSLELARITGYPSRAIRKDILELCSLDIEKGGGALVDPLALSLKIRKSLSPESKVWKCCVVGLGRLGCVLLSCAELLGYHVIIRAGFDASVNRVEALESPCPLYPSFRMKELIPRLDISIALLCVPEVSAQEAADKLFALGVKGILNFTPATIAPVEGAVVKNASVAGKLEELALGFSFNKFKFLGDANGARL